MEINRNNAGHFVHKSHRFIESFSLEKTLKIIEFNQSQNTDIAIEEWHGKYIFSDITQETRHASSTAA